MLMDSVENKKYLENVGFLNDYIVSILNVLIAFSYLGSFQCTS